MKSILLFGSLFLISAAFIIQTMDVSVSTNLPDKLTPGSSVEFEVTINKSGVTGFSKFQMEFPEGLTPELIDGKDGTFSFTDQQLKIIWVSLPAENPFKIKFKLASSSEVKGSFPLKGVFSYVQNGERQNKEFNHVLTVGDVAAIATAPVSAPAQNVATVAATSSDLSFVRTLSKDNVLPNQSVIVNLEITKGKISGFGKITETIPVGYSAEQMETNGGIFSVSGNSVRFLWMTLPSEDKFKISYKLTADATVGKREITGSFSYVKDDQTMLLNTATNYFEVPSDQGEMLAQSTPAQAATPEKVAEPAEEAPVAIANNPKSEAVAATRRENVSNSGSSADVSYRVQICATRKPVDTEYFVKNNNVQVQIYADMHEGWHKFTVGGFGVYSEARNYREAVKESYNIKNPFVTAYNNGSRITVQEALMISKQTWVP